MTGHPWRSAAALGASVGLLIAGAVMYVAWDHNPQGAIHNEYGVSWGYWLLTGFSGFAPVALGVGLVSGVVLSLLARIQRGR